MQESFLTSTFPFHFLLASRLRSRFVNESCFESALKFVCQQQRSLQAQFAQTMRHTKEITFSGTQLRCRELMHLQLLTQSLVEFRPKVFRVQFDCPVKPNLLQRSFNRLSARMSIVLLTRKKTMSRSCVELFVAINVDNTNMGGGGGGNMIKTHN
jgi:hypothetical protein